MTIPSPFKSDRMLKELPEDLEAHKSREYVIMDLDQACDFFETIFKEGRGVLSFFR